MELLLVKELHVVVIKFVVQGDTSGFNGNTTLLFVLTGIGKTSFTSLLLGNDTWEEGHSVKSKQLVFSIAY